MKPMSLALLCLTLAGMTGSACQNAPVPRPELTAPVQASTNPDTNRVLVVANRRSSDSVALAAYYRQKRGLRTDQILLIDVEPNEEITTDLYRRAIEGPVLRTVDNARTRVDFILLTKGVPIRLDGPNGYSVDATLAASRLPARPITELNEQQIRQAISPYFDKKEPFNSAKFRMWLVTRLDGYTLADAKKLVDNAIAAKPANGPFFFDTAGNRTDGGYGQMQSEMRAAFNQLRAAGKTARLDESTEFIAPTEPLMGYVSWGSNDGAFDEFRYRSIRFLPGAIAETYVSTSGRTFRPTQGGQSLIADLIKSGVTGVKGYVSEPYTFALARVPILFDRYINGYTLAESFYAASPVIKWKDVVIGDPIARPYAKR